MTQMTHMSPKNQMSQIIDHDEDTPQPPEQAPEPAPEQNPDPAPAQAPEQDGQIATATKTAPKPKSKPPKPLPLWKVLLHNDPKSYMEDVVDTIVMLTTLNKQDAEIRTLEAHDTGVALLLTTHQERAELYRDQFTSRRLTVTIEPTE